MEKIKQVFTQIHIDLAEVWKMEEWATIHGDPKMLDYTVGMIQEDMGLLNEKNNHCRKEIDNASSEWKTLFEIIRRLETHINELETIMDTQQHDIDRLKRNIATLDGNMCCC